MGPGVQQVRDQAPPGHLQQPGGQQPHAAAMPLQLHIVKEGQATRLLVPVQSGLAVLLLGETGEEDTVTNPLA